MPKLPIISAVPASETTDIRRPVSVKRLARLRLNWFVVGSVFGIALSFFMSFLLANLVLPHYRAVMAEKQVDAAEISSLDTLSSHTPVADATPTTSAAPTITPAPPISVAETRHEKLGDAAAVTELASKVSPAATAAVTANALQPVTPQAAAQVAVVKTALKKPSNRRFGVIKTSLFQGGASAGIPFTTMNEIVKAFSYDVDFQRDIHPGDTIEVLMGDATTTKPAKSGKGKAGKTAAAKPTKSGQTLRYAALTLNGEKHEIFRFTIDGTTGWYDAAGRSIKKSLLATPISVAHITSGFGMREHPVLGYTKFHKGVDFGAAQGTPILAAGDGTVEFKGWKSGYGNFVILKHNSTYETAYGHISRFGKITVGSRVKQGQVIAYVGMTGMATGPHLHYEVRVNGDQVNPVAKQFNMASGLSGKSLAQFKASKTAIQRELALAAKPQNVASAK